MCGIVGFINQENNKEAVIKKMMVRINHRGPDGEGTFIDENIKEENMLFFADPQDAIRAHALGKLGTQQKIQVRVNKEVIETSVGRILFNQVLPEQMRFLNQVIKGITIRDIILKATETLSKEVS